MNAPAELPQAVKIERKIYTGLALRVLKLLCSGCNQTQAATALGISEGYVSQLCNEEDFQIQIAEALQRDYEKAAAIDQNYLDMERSLSDKLKSLVPLMHSPDQILRVIRFVNEAKKKTQPVSPLNGTVNGNGVNGNPIIGKLQVALVLPNVMAKQFVTNPNNEVVEVDGTELVTLNSESLQTLVTQHRTKKLPKPDVKPRSITLTNEDLSNL